MIIDGTAKFEVKRINAVTNVQGGGNILTITKQDGGKADISIGYVLYKNIDIANITVLALKNILLEAIRSVDTNNVKELVLCGWGNGASFVENMTNDAYVLPPGGLTTIRVSNIHPAKTYAHIDLYSYAGKIISFALIDGLISPQYTSTGDINWLKNKLASLEEHIKKLESKDG